MYISRHKWRGHKLDSAALEMKRNRKKNIQNEEEHTRTGRRSTTLPGPVAIAGEVLGSAQESYRATPRKSNALFTVVVVLATSSS